MGNLNVPVVAPEPWLRPFFRNPSLRCLIVVIDSNRPLLCVLGLRGIPRVMGGVETHCEELLPRIAAKAPELEIEVVARRPYVAEPTSVGGVTVTPRFSTRGQGTEALTSTLMGIAYARRRGARAVHIHAVGPALLAQIAGAIR